MALIPVLWLALKGRDRDAAWWWLSGIFLISWLADTASHTVGHPLMGTVYPVSQAAIVGAVFLPRRDAIILVLALTVVAGGDIAWKGVTGTDVFLRTVAWGAAAGVVFPLWQLGRLRTALLVTFGAGLLAWWGYVLAPGWISWSGYQGVRLASILLFCWASMQTTPHFKLSTR